MAHMGGWPSLNPKTNFGYGRLVSPTLCQRYFPNHHKIPKLCKLVATARRVVDPSSVSATRPPNDIVTLRFVEGL